VTVLMSSRYAGLSPKQLVPQLADEGLYLASESTMYRVQRRHGLRLKKPTTPRTHIARASTVHQATGQNQVWSWDITWLPTTVRCSYLYLYLIMCGIHRHRFNSRITRAIWRLGEARPKASAICVGLPWLGLSFQSLYRIRSFGSS